MRSKFKDEHKLEKRKAEADRIRQKYADRIPVCRTCQDSDEDANDDRWSVKRSRNQTLPQSTRRSISCQRISQSVNSSMLFERESSCHRKRPSSSLLMKFFHQLPHWCQASTMNTKMRMVSCTSRKSHRLFCRAKLTLIGTLARTLLAGKSCDCGKQGWKQYQEWRWIDQFRYIQYHYTTNQLASCLQYACSVIFAGIE